MALRPGIPFVSEGYVVMTIELNISKAWDYKMYGHYLLFKLLRASSLARS